jgi:hypothetical protein
LMHAMSRFPACVFTMLHDTQESMQSVRTNADYATRPLGRFRGI